VNNFITPGFQDQISAACILNIGFACALYNTCQVKKAGFFQPALSLFNLPVDQRYFLILQFMPSIRFPYSDGDREPGIRYCGRSAELVFRLRITFSAAVIVVDFLHHGMVGSPVELPVRRAIVMALVEFWFKPGSRAIKMLPGMIAGAAVTDTVPIKIVTSGPIRFLKLVASIRTAVADSFALGPGISGQGHHKSNQYNADNNDPFFHGLPPCFRDLMHGFRVV
jgi:hypothetical protein